MLKRLSKKIMDVEAEEVDAAGIEAEIKSEEEDVEELVEVSKGGKKEKGAAASKKGTSAAEKKKLKNKRLRDDMRDWVQDNKVEMKKLRKMEKATQSSVFAIGSISEFRKTFAKNNKKKEEEIHYTHILPLFVFLNKTSIVLDGIGEFDGTFKGKTSAGEDFANEIAKLHQYENEEAEDDEEDEDMKIGLTKSDVDALLRKYGKKWWKLPKRGNHQYLKRNGDPSAFKGKRKVKVTLVDISANVAVMDDGKGMGFISPVLRYEYV